MIDDDMCINVLSCDQIKLLKDLLICLIFWQEIIMLTLHTWAVLIILLQRSKWVVGSQLDWRLAKTTSLFWIKNFFRLLQIRIVTLTCLNWKFLSWSGLQFDFFCLCECSNFSGFSVSLLINLGNMLYTRPTYSYCVEMYTLKGIWHLVYVKILSIIFLKELQLVFIHWTAYFFFFCLKKTFSCCLLG